MSYTVYEESLCVDKSFTSTPTSHRFTHTTSSNFYKDSSLVSIFCNRTSTVLDARKLPSTTHNLNYGLFKLKDSSKVKDQVAICDPLLSVNQKPSKKLTKLSCYQIQLHQTNPCTKYDLKFLNSKNLNLFRSIYKRISLEGKKKVDFMYYLSKRYSFAPVTEKIFSFLHGKDILAMSMVSKTWHNAVKYSPSAKRKKKSHVMYMRSEKENHGHVERKRLCLSSRRVFGDISNIMHFPLK